MRALRHVRHFVPDCRQSLRLSQIIMITRVRDGRACHGLCPWFQSKTGTDEGPPPTPRRHFLTLKEGFEPSDPCGPPVFKTGAFSPSATSASLNKKDLFESWNPKRSSNADIYFASDYDINSPDFMRTLTNHLIIWWLRWDEHEIWLKLNAFISFLSSSERLCVPSDNTISSFPSVVMLPVVATTALYNYWKSLSSVRCW